MATTTSSATVSAVSQLQRRPHSSPGMLFAKTDSLGDQLLCTGLVDRLRALGRGTLIWCVRPGYDAIGQLLPGSVSFSARDDRPPAEEAKRLHDQAADGAGAWAGTVFLPVPFNGYWPWRDQARTPAQLAWWLAFVRALDVEAAVAGTINLNWVDHALVLASAAPARIAVAPHRSCNPVPDEVRALLRASGAPADFTASFAHDPRRHEMDSFAALMGAMNGDDRPLAFAPTLAIPHWQAGRAGARRILIAPGTADRARMTPPTVLADVIAALAPELPADSEIRLVCGPADGEACAAQAAALRARGIASSDADLRSAALDRLALALAECDLLFCFDTFIAHLAASVGTPTVAIYGGGNGGRFHCRQGHVSIVAMDVACAGCEWSCCFGQRRCLTDIGADFVASVARERLAAPAAPVTLNRPPLTIAASEIAAARALPAHPLRRGWRYLRAAIRGG
jgi:ADP-heptose:LPS heptosyltransferase